jgi:hypothetical protein
MKAKFLNIRAYWMTKGKPNQQDVSSIRRQTK